MEKKDFSVIFEEDYETELECTLTLGENFLTIRKNGKSASEYNHRFSYDKIEQFGIRVTTFVAQPGFFFEVECNDGKLRMFKIRLTRPEVGLVDDFITFEESLIMRLSKCNGSDADFSSFSSESSESEAGEEIHDKNEKIEVIEIIDEVMKGSQSVKVVEVVDGDVNAKLGPPTFPRGEKEEIVVFPDVWIPNEIIAEILLYLCITDVLKFGRASRRFREIASSDAVWKHLSKSKGFIDVTLSVPQRNIHDHLHACRTLKIPRKDVIVMRTPEIEKFTGFPKKKGRDYFWMSRWEKGGGDRFYNSTEKPTFPEKDLQQYHLDYRKAIYDSKSQVIRSSKGITSCSKSMSRVAWIYVILPILFFSGALITITFASVSISFLNYWWSYLVCILILCIVVVPGCLTFLVCYFVQSQIGDLLNDDFYRYRDFVRGLQTWVETPEEKVAMLKYIVMLGLLNIGVFIFCFLLKGVFQEVTNFYMSLCFIPYYLASLAYFIFTIYLFFGTFPKIEGKLYSKLDCQKISKYCNFYPFNFMDYDDYRFDLGVSLPVCIIILFTDIQLVLFGLYFDNITHGFSSEVNIFIVFIPSFIYFILGFLAFPIGIYAAFYPNSIGSPNHCCSGGAVHQKRCFPSEYSHPVAAFFISNSILMILCVPLFIFVVVLAILIVTKSILFFAFVPLIIFTCLCCVVFPIIAAFSTTKEMTDRFHMIDTQKLKNVSGRGERV